jgi:hypothetical protein
MVFDLFKKKVRVNLFLKETNNFVTLDGKIKYDKKDKMWFLQIKKEKIPVPQNIWDFVIDKNIYMIRTGTDQYAILNVKNIATGHEPQVYDITPSDLYTALVKAEMRRERMKSTMEKLLPIVMVVIAMIGIGIFLAIVWSTTANSMKEISMNFDSAMKTLQNLTMEQNNLIRELKGGAPLPTR